MKVKCFAMMMVLAVGCSSEPAPAPGRSVSPSEAPAAESPSPQPSAIESVPATGGTDDPFKLVSPEAAAAHLFEAWKKGDKAMAAKFAEQDAVDTLLSRPYTGPDPEFMGCEHEVDHYFCRYRFEGSSMTFRVDGGVSAGYYVTEVTETAD
jgi:hypothetical protein